jgi:hypothetical protein
MNSTLTLNALFNTFPWFLAIQIAQILLLMVNIKTSYYAFRHHIKGKVTISMTTTTDIQRQDYVLLVAAFVQFFLIVLNFDKIPTLTL